MSMTVFLKLATGDLIDVEVAASETVGEVKRKTAKASRVQEEQIALSYEDNILNDAEVMDSLGLVQDAVIDVVPNRYQVALRMVEKATQVPFVPSNYAAITRSQIRDLTVLEHVLFLFENCPAAESDLKCAITEMVQVAISNQLEDAVLPLLARHPRIHSYLASSDLGRSPTVSLPFLQHLVRYFGPFAPSQIAFLENVRFSQAEAAPIVALLLENGLDINSKVQQKWYLPRTVPHNAGLTILMGLLGFGKIHTAILGDILKNGWADLSVRCCKGLTALHYAAIGSNYESLESMPGYGVDMTVVDFRQRTVLHHFVIKHHGSVMAVPDCLLQFAARQDSGGRTALFYLLRYGPEERGIEYNLKAFYSANGNMYREEDRNGETLLHAAVGHRSAQFTMGVVLQHAANVLPYEWFASFLNTKNHIGDTALDSCCKKHHITSLQALLSRGAVVGLGLTNAVFSMNKDIMRMLVVHHMDRSVVLQHLAGGRLRQCSRAFIYHLIRFEKDR